jgi:hypothetical protein
MLWKNALPPSSASKNKQSKWAESKQQEHHQKSSLTTRNNYLKLEVLTAVVMKVLSSGT